MTNAEFALGARDEAAAVLDTVRDSLNFIFWHGHRRPSEVFHTLTFGRTHSASQKSSEANVYHADQARYMKTFPNICHGLYLKPKAFAIAQCVFPSAYCKARDVLVTQLLAMPRFGSKSIA